ncbi:MAG: hypothetical protein WA961_16255 [Rhodanobacter sp.]|jgi:hypothetical protein
MGNTNLPQFGAADTRNSRDTLSGEEQLTDEERKREREPGDAGPAPGRPKNAPARVPGQQRGDGEVDDVEAAREAERVRRRAAGPDDDPRHPDPVAARAGHANSGYSGPKAS